MDTRTRHQLRHHRPGVASILSMMFLVIFGSLAAAMAIVAQGNLATADSYLKINRSLAAAETGMRFAIYRLNQVTAEVRTRDGVIDADNAPDLWELTQQGLLTAFANEFHNVSEPYVQGGALHVGPIAVGPNEPTFTVTFTPHPLTGENYDSSYYQRAPYSGMDPPVSAASPLDATWIRVRVEASDGRDAGRITRAIQMDFRMEKKIRFAILSRSRVMIGRNVMIEGPIGSRFLETHLTNGHPVQMVSDFRGLDAALDAQLNTFVATLATNDHDGDNRLNLNNPLEVDGIADPAQYDLNADGYVDDYDFFVDHYDTSPKDGRVTALELDAAANPYTAQLLELIDTFGDATRPGHGDGVIDNDDNYVKIRGQVMISATLQSWQDGAAEGTYQDYFQGSIQPGHNEAALTFEASENNLHQFTPSDFDVTTFRNLATSDLATVAAQQAALYDPDDPASPRPLGTTVNESVPFAAAHPYDYYDRPVYENMTFTNVRIPKGTNALFKNCRFIGVTFVETETANTDMNYNYAGMRNPDGTLKYPNLAAAVGGQAVADTKTISNNIRFDGCTFEGAVVADSANEYTHVRNKLAFTGHTRFQIEESQNLTDAEKALYRRSTMLVPNYSVELGTFISPYDNNEAVTLSGTIVAGILDMRGQVKVNGSILTTFEPESNTGPVIGETSPQFNTTLGYFSSANGDMESELPTGGIGVIQVRYDPTLPLPDGILGPIHVTPVTATYFETGALDAR